MRLSFKQVRHFLATVDAGQVSLAAIALNVSQSAVTTALQQLEAELGVSLFDRGPSGMHLTLEGARFVQHARNIMAAVNEAVSSPLTEDTSHTGRVRVGVTYTVAGYFLPRHLARFSRTYPGIKVDLVELPREVIERGIVDRTLDIAVMLVSNLQNRRDTTYETLVYSRRRLWLSVEHPLLRASTLTLEDVAKEP
jgi:DNA-binding transcriptional LysR family regulator